MKRKYRKRVVYRTPHVIYEIRKVLPNLSAGLIKDVLEAYKGVVQRALLSGAIVHVATGSMHLWWSNGYRRVGRDKQVRTFPPRWKCKLYISTSFNKQLKETPRGCYA